MTGRFWLRTGMILAISLGLAAALAVNAGTEGARPLQPDYAWAQPQYKALKQLAGTAQPIARTPLQTNLECQPMMVKKLQDSNYQPACALFTAVGYYDLNNNLLLFSGGGRAVPIRPYGAHDILLPVPGTVGMLNLLPQLNGGTRLQLYRYLPSVLQDERNGIGQLTAKRISGPADLDITDSDGAPLIINPQTINFSDNRAWAIAETTGSTWVRINLATLDVKPFGKSYWNNGGVVTGHSVPAVSNDGRYIAVVNNSLQTFRVYDLQACGQKGEPASSCRFYDYWPFASGQLGNTSPLISDVGFVNSGILAFTSGGKRYELAPAASIDFRTDYLALGDSYASGEGAYAYLPNTDTGSNHCHLSANAYPARLQRNRFSSAGAHSVACSGALIRDIGDLSPGYVGQAENGLSLAKLQTSQPAFYQQVQAGYLPGYIAQGHFVESARPRLISVMISGNDAGFGRIMARCVLPHLARSLNSNTCYNTYEDRLELQAFIDRQTPELRELYRGLKKQAPGATIYAIGYPQLADDRGNCGLNVHLNQTELAFSAVLIDFINLKIAQAAGEAGIHYIDISGALEGHKLCQGPGYTQAVNGITAGDDKGIAGINFLGKESFHPNALGHELMERAILQATRNFKNPPVNAAPDSGTTNTKMTSAPKTGRPVRTVTPDKIVKTPKPIKGKPVKVKAAGRKASLKPRTSYKVHLDGPRGPLLGTVTSDDKGDISGEVNLPPATATGGHTVDIIGGNQADEPVTVSDDVYVGHSPDDTDGDGVPNAADSCPFAANSGSDADKDGIDDVCDPSIGTGGSSQTPGVGSGSGGGQPDSAATNPPPHTAPPTPGTAQSSPSLGTALQEAANWPLSPAAANLSLTSGAIRAATTAATPPAQPGLAVSPAQSRPILQGPRQSKTISLRSSRLTVMGSPHTTRFAALPVIAWYWWAAAAMLAYALLYLVKKREWFIKYSVN